MDASACARASARQEGREGAEGFSRRTQWTRGALCKSHGVIAKTELFCTFSVQIFVFHRCPIYGVHCLTGSIVSPVSKLHCGVENLISPVSRDGREGDAKAV
jgi:hypothetical protein